MSRHFLETVRREMRKIPRLDTLTPPTFEGSIQYTHASDNEVTKTLVITEYYGKNLVNQKNQLKIIFVNVYYYANSL